MRNLLTFKNSSYYSKRRKQEPTIAGEAFQALMDLCFDRADCFSLHRCGWEKAWDGTLEQALRPFCLGEYLSYARIQRYDGEFREKCYVYRASRKAKAIFLQHWTHLFDREISRAPAGHDAYLREKYAAYDKAAEAASERVGEFLDHAPRDLSDAAFHAFLREAYREAETLRKQVFSERDYYANMEDPCFFDNGVLFLETVTHETLCFADADDPAFAAALRRLGDWAEERTSRPPVRLEAMDGYRRYGL